MPKRKFDDDTIIGALRTCNGNRARAAELLGLAERQLRRRVALMKEKGVSVPEPTVQPVIPEGHNVSGVSTLQKIDDPETGTPVLQWVKTRADVKRQQEALQAAMQVLFEDIPRVKVRQRAKGFVNKQLEALLNLHILTDFHLGMLAWHRETGADWDLDIARRILIEMFRYGIEHSPPAKVGFLGQLGDFMHYDSLESVTPTSKHILDADSRPDKMVSIGYQTLRIVIDMMLQKYEQVHVLMAEGNHDPNGSVHMRNAFMP